MSQIISLEIVQGSDALILPPEARGVNAKRMISRVSEKELHLLRGATKELYETVKDHSNEKLQNGALIIERLLSENRVAARNRRRGQAKIRRANSKSGWSRFWGGVTGKTRAEVAQGARLAEVSSCAQARLMKNAVEGVEQVYGLLATSERLKDNLWDLDQMIVDELLNRRRVHFFFMVRIPGKRIALRNALSAGSPVTAFLPQAPSL